MHKLSRALVLALALATLSTSGCVWIASSSISDSQKQGPGVSYIVNGMGLLHLTAPGDITPAANQGLVALCPNGRVTDVQTQLSVRDYFFVVQIYELWAGGVCN